MEFAFALLTELFFEFFGQGFLFFCSFFVPDVAQKRRNAKILCLIVSLTLLAGLAVGIVILSETGGKNPWGWVLIALNAVYLVSGVICAIVLRCGKRRRGRD